MMNYECAEHHWNLFACALEGILRAHGYGLEDLYHPVCGIHQQKVSRLRESLTSPEHFPVLPPKEIALIVHAFNLTQDEVLYLRAAIVATSVERTLIQRLPNKKEEALQESKVIFRLALAALRKQVLVHVRGGTTMRQKASLHLLLAQHLPTDERRGTTMPQETTSFDEAEAVPTLDPALEAIDQAAFALHFSSDPDASTEHRLDQLKQARDAFRRALDHLHRSPDVIKELPAWQVWHSEAEQELLQVCERLAELEADQTAGT